jgi:hypothetical protein
MNLGPYPIPFNLNPSIILQTRFGNGSNKEVKKGIWRRPFPCTDRSVSTNPYRIHFDPAPSIIF